MAGGRVRARSSETINHSNIQLDKEFFIAENRTRFVHVRLNLLVGVLLSIPVVGQITGALLIVNLVLGARDFIGR